MINTFVKQSVKLHIELIYKFKDGKKHCQFNLLIYTKKMEELL